MVEEKPAAFFIKIRRLFFPTRQCRIEALEQVTGVAVVVDAENERGKNEFCPCL